VSNPAAAVTDPDTQSRYYTHPRTGELLDRVTTIIDGTDEKRHLKTWYGKVSTAWAVDNMQLLARTLREEGRDAAIALGTREGERRRKLKADTGTHVHDVAEALILWAASPEGTGGQIPLPLLPEHLEGALYDLGDGVFEPLSDVVDYMVDGFIAFVTHFGPRFLAKEMPVYSLRLGYGGTLDMIIKLTGYAISYGTGSKGADEIVASPGSVLRICVDVKTGKDPKGTWKEQLAAYRRAEECAPSLGDLRPMLPTDCGAVLHLRPDYPDGYLLMLVSASEDESAWGRFAKAASVYRERQKVKDRPGTAVRALRADGTMPGPRLCDLASEGYGRALAPLRKALGAATELEDLARFTEAEVLAVKGIGPKLIDVIKEMLDDHGLSLAGEVPLLAEVA
jgi:hypothetical protein